MVLKEVTLLCIIETFLKCYADSVAYTPKGFKASIPALKGIKLFAFHGNLNKGITSEECGEFGGNFMRPTNDNEWSYYNKNVILKPGDTIHYWAFIQYEKIVYRYVDKWTVSKLLDVNIDCEFNSSVVANKTFICTGSVILEVHFDNDQIDKSKWLVEQFTHFKKVVQIRKTRKELHFFQDFGFVSYQNKPDICYTQAGKLFIKPKALQNESIEKTVLDLRTGCTRRRPNECGLVGVLMFPPLISVKILPSGRMVSLVNFRYGKIEIKAKLPAGDWIYPRVYLEDISNPLRKLWIAFSRGNIHLQTSNGDDIGGHLLYGGLVSNSSEPERSTYLRIKNNTSSFSNQMHTYTVIWQKDRISLRVDGREYGRISKSEMKKIKFAENNLARLVLGVGVGGIHDFPDDSGTGDSIKPWKNNEEKQMKNFFTARNEWGKSWDGDNSALQIEYIKITALTY